jgi:hypothetical protein
MDMNNRAALVVCRATGREVPVTLKLDDGTILTGTIEPANAVLAAHALLSQARACNSRDEMWAEALDRGIG